MSVKYIGKKKLHELVKKLTEDEEFPLCKDCRYCTFRDLEKLVCNDYTVFSRLYGTWVKIVHVYSLNGMTYERVNIYAHPKNGVYEYHSSREKVLGFDLKEG